MKLSDKIVRLRKSNGMSQEELADKLGVSRQAISRWEMGTAMPDATNILQLSRLFQVTTDYLLNDEYQSDNDLPKVKEVKTDGIHQIMIFLITLEVMVLIIQFMSVMILQNIFFGVLSFIPFFLSKFILISNPSRRWNRSLPDLSRRDGSLNNTI